MGGLLFFPHLILSRERLSFLAEYKKSDGDTESKSLIETKSHIEINSLIEKERSPVHVHALVAAPSSLVTIKWA